MELQRLIKKYWKWFVGLLIPTAFAASIIVPTLDDIDIPLKEIQIIGSRYVYCDGEEITAEEYASFALPDAPPVKCTIVKTHKFNTPDGKIDTNQYYLDGGRKYARLSTTTEDVIDLDKGLKGATFKNDILKITNKDSFEEYAKD